MGVTTGVSRTIDRVAGGRHVSRRDIMQAMSALGIGVIAAPLAPAGAKGAADKLTYFTWSGYEVSDLHPPFVEKYGDGRVRGVFFGVETEALAKMRNGFVTDISHPCGHSVPRWVEAGVVSPIDVSRLSNWPDVFPRLRDLPDTIHDGDHFMVPFDWGSSSVLYRTDLVDPKYAEDPTWGIFYDDAYAGRLAMYDTSIIVDIAMMVSGAEDLTSFSNEQLVEVRPLMEKGNSLLRYYWSDPLEVTEDLASGEIVAAYAWNGMTKTLVEQGVPVTYMNPKEGQLSWVCGLAIDPRSEADDVMVYDFIDAMISPEAGAFQIEDYAFGHSNMKAFDLVSPEILVALGLSDPSAALDRCIFVASLPADLENKLTNLADEVKAGL